MNAHLAEVAAETRFEERPHRVAERLASARRHHAGARDCGHATRGLLLAVYLLVFVGAFRAEPSDTGAGAALSLNLPGGLNKQGNLRIGHANDLFGDTVGFLLENIAGFVDAQFGLEQVPDSSVTDCLLKADEGMVRGHFS